MKLLIVLLILGFSEYSIAESCSDIITTYNGEKSWFALDRYKNYSQALKKKCDIENEKAICEYISQPMTAINCASLRGDIKTLEAFLFRVSDGSRQEVLKEAFAVAASSRTVNSLKLMSEKYDIDYAPVYEDAKGEFRLSLDILRYKKTVDTRKDFVSTVACQMDQNDLSTFYHVSNHLLKSNRGDIGLRSFVKDLDSLRTEVGFKTHKNRCALTKKSSAPGANESSGSK